MKEAKATDKSSLRLLRTVEPKIISRKEDEKGKATINWNFVEKAIEGLLAKRVQVRKAQIGHTRLLSVSF